MLTFLLGYLFHGCTPLTMRKPVFHPIILHIVVNICHCLRAQLLKYDLVDSKGLKDISNEDLYLLDWWPSLFELVDLSDLNFVDSYLSIDFDSWLDNLTSLLIILVNLNKAIESYCKVELVIKVCESFDIHN